MNPDQPSSFSFEHLFPGLRSFFKWCHDTSLGAYISREGWAFKFIETVHILALAVLLGTVLIVNLRRLGALRAWSSAQLSRELSPYLNLSLVVALVTGLMLFSSQAPKYYQSAAFGPKMLFLAGAILFQFALYPRPKAEETSIWGKVAACLSLALWFSVGAAGRAIGFVP